MNDILSMVASLLKTMVCNVRIVKHKSHSKYEYNTYTIELLNDNGLDWYVVGCMNRGGGVTLYAPELYTKVDYDILMMYRCEE